MEDWSFLSKHGRVLLCIAHDPGVRLRDIAASVGITERSAYGIVTDLAAAGYAVKRKDGRRNRYQIQARLPPPGPAGRHLAIGEVLALLAGATAPPWAASRPEETSRGPAPPPAQHQLSPEGSPHDDNRAPRA
jgi:hypothetical protein